MTDLLQESSAWLEGKRDTLLVGSVTYFRGATPYVINATKGKTIFEQMTNENVITEVTTTDFIFKADDIQNNVVEPQEGDTILETIDNIAYTYEVKGFKGQRPFSLDNYKLSYRVNTILIDQTSG